MAEDRPVLWRGNAWAATDGVEEWYFWKQSIGKTTGLEEGGCLMLREMRDLMCEIIQ